MEKIKNILDLINDRLIEFSAKDIYPEKEPEFNSIYNKCKNYTMTSKERMYALYNAIKYVLEHNIDGDIVECGVWKGGSSMLSALTLIANKKFEKNLYLYDTYSGMSKPTEKDVDYKGYKSLPRWEKLEKEDFNAWDFSPLSEVKTNMLKTGYPEKKIFFIKGKVEDTIPETMPSKISILRLDTDWYESTYHELLNLFPLLSKGGVIIIDDYGHWKGVKDAVDKYFRDNNIKILLNRIDYTGRIGMKLN